MEEPAPEVTPNLQHAMRTNQKSTLKRGRKPKKHGGKASKKTGNKSSCKSKTATKATRASTGKRKLATLRAKNSPEKTAVPIADAEPKPSKPKTRKASKAVDAEAVATKSTRKKKVENPKGKRKVSTVSQEEVQVLEEVPSGSGEGAVWKKRKDTETHKVVQGRVQEGGKKWRYEVLPNQVFGCSNCRFIFNGCTLCRRPAFRGKTAYQVRQEMKEAAAVQEEEAAAAAAKVRSAGSKASKSKGKRKAGKKTKKSSKASNP